MDYYLTVRDDRELWRKQTPDACMYCGQMNVHFPLEIHEIERKSHAPERWGVRSNYLKLCRYCHSHEFAAMPHAKQLAVKLCRDIDNFDLDEWLRIRDPELRAPERVTLQDVVQYLRVC